MIANLRDLGGIGTRDGRRIRRGCLVRSAHLALAEERDLKGVSAVIDLRTPGEREKEPDRTWQRQYLPLSVFDEAQAGISREQMSAEWMLPEFAELYGWLIRECAGSFREILLKIMGHDFSTGAVLWHCTEGKDRCGLTSALILEILGVNRDTILADYLKTNLVSMPKAISLRDRFILTCGKEYADRVYQGYIADESYLQAAWDAMGDAYITDRLGITEEQIRAFRATVLE